MATTVCIVGAGISGLASIKCCLEENLVPVCYERKLDVGGLWNPSQAADYQGGKLYNSLIPNVDKESFSFSDYPFPEHVTPFPSADEILKYLKSYVDTFDLRKYIVFNTDIVWIKKLDHGWEVTTKDRSTNTTLKHTYDKLMVCSGEYSAPNIPHVEGIETFTGDVKHSSQFVDSDSDGVEGKNVLVVGCGSSGCDIALEYSRNAKKTLLCCRNGVHIIPRVNKRGIPHSAVFMNRFEYTLTKYLPKFIYDWYFTRKCDRLLDHSLYNLKSKYGVFDPRATLALNDDMVIKVAAGIIKTKPEISRIEQDKIIFVDGTTEQIDSIMFATGYKPKYPFISNDILPDELCDFQLFKWIFPLTINDPDSMAVIGLVAFPGLGACANLELQARYAARVLSGDISLPEPTRMRQIFEEDFSKHMLHGRFIFKLRPYSYLEDIASCMGVKPSFWRLLFTDPAMAFAVYFGPFLPYHYRISGKHSWRKATAEFMLGTYNRLFSSFVKRKALIES